MKSFVNKLNRPKWSYNDVPNNVKANVQESPKMVVELDNTVSVLNFEARDTGNNVLFSRKSNLSLI